MAALFVVDPTLWRPAGAARQAWLLACLSWLDAALGGRLAVRYGEPSEVVPAFAAELDADEVHITADAGPYGRHRDAAVAARLARDGRRLVATGTPYAVPPGTLRTAAGRPYAVFSPYYRAWQRHGHPAPFPAADAVAWAAGVASQGLPEPPGGAPADLPEAGEDGAVRAWESFLNRQLAGYAGNRDRPDLDATSHLSPYLKLGAIHPRTLLADLADVTGARPPGSAGEAPGVAALVRELAWREFCADQLWHAPYAARRDLRPAPAGLRHDVPGEQLAAWQAGRTGYPLVDAGMRQLARQGWLPNRVRMVVAGFLVKDLHLPWQLGARWFMQRLLDGDLASNSLNWQWVAGSGSDAAPYFRVFNPVTQGLRFDPDGRYVRRWVPELDHLPGVAAHSPWDHPQGYARGYPRRIVDHAAERAEALARLAQGRRRPDGQ